MLAAPQMEVDEDVKSTARNGRPSSNSLGFGTNSYALGGVGATVNSHVQVIKVGVDYHLAGRVGLVLNAIASARCASGQPVYGRTRGSRFKSEDRAWQQHGN
jgi:hypothetical protein